MIWTEEVKLWVYETQIGQPQCALNDVVADTVLGFELIFVSLKNELINLFLFLMWLMGFNRSAKIGVWSVASRNGCCNWIASILLAPHK